jgi:hypothetical protein
MLPAWATVTLAIVSGLAGIVGGIAVTHVRIRFDREQATATRDHERRQQEARLAHERDEQWRDRLVDAAVEFSTGVQQALLRAHEAIQAAGDVGEHQRALAESRRVIGEAIARVGRVKLLFGEGTAPSEIAGDVIRALEATVARAREANAEAPSRQPAWTHLDEAYARHRDFNTAALEMISRPEIRGGHERAV